MGRLASGGAEISAMTSAHRVDVRRMGDKVTGLFEHVVIDV